MRKPPMKVADNSASGSAPPAAVAFPTAARRETKRFLKFLVVGGMSFVVDTGSLSTLVFAFEVNRVAAKGIAFCLAVLSSYLGSHFWIYPESRPQSVLAQVIQFLTVSLIGLAINLSVFGLVDRLFSGFLDAVLRLYVAQCAAVGTALIWNFAANRLVTYRDVNIGR